MVADKCKFNFGGRKYTLYLDDGYVSSVRLPGGKWMRELPLELAANSRLQRFLAQKQKSVREMRAFLDEDMRRAWGDDE